MLLKVFVTNLSFCLLNVFQDAHTRTHTQNVHWHEYVGVYLIIKKKEGKEEEREGEKEGRKTKQKTETGKKSVKNKSETK